MAEGKAKRLREEFLRILARGDWIRGARVPTIRRLAHTYTSSQALVIRVLKGLTDEGVLVYDSHSRSYRVPDFGSSQQESLKVRRRKRSEEVADDLRDRILGGHFDMSRGFSSKKRLQRDYACSDRTVKEAVDILVRKRYLRKKGNTYVGGHARSSKHETAPAVYLTGGTKTLLRLMQSQMYAFILGLKAELRVLDWAPLRILARNRNTPEHPLAASMPEPHKVAGFIHFVEGSQSTPDRDRHFSTYLNVPTVLVDHSAITCDRKSSIRSPEYLIVTDQYSAGTDVARHLASLGHRNVAFISLWPPEDAWVRLRLQGAESILGPVGSEENPRGLSAYIPSRSEVRSRKGVDMNLYTAPADLLRRRLKESDVGQAYPEIVNEILRPVLDFKVLLNQTKTLYPLFERILRRTETTAWMCANDTVAIAAATFLKRRGIRIPEDLSITGFDAGPGAAVLGISSYDFELERIGRTAIRTLLHRDSLVTSKDRRLFVKGHVLADRSTSPPGG